MRQGSQSKVRSRIVKAWFAAGSGCPQARVGAGRILVRAMERVGTGAMHELGS